MQIHKILSNNIVLSGGSTLLHGFADRLRKELILCSSFRGLIDKEITGRVPILKDINVLALPGREYGPWIGGSKLATLDTFKRVIIHFFSL